MPLVSGSVFYHHSVCSSADIGLSGISVALYDTTMGLRAAALTNAAGAYQFTRVPPGCYTLVCCGELAGTVGTVDFFACRSAGVCPPEQVPPLSALPFLPPAAVSALTALSPCLISLTLAASDLSRQNFFFGPVGHQPLDFSGLTPTGENLITAADGGTFGSYPCGTACGTRYPVDPYPGVSAGANYITDTTESGASFTVLNTPDLSEFSACPVSDHTTQLETGRALLCRGVVRGTCLFAQSVTVTPHTNYLLSAWVLSVLGEPLLSLRVLDSGGTLCAAAPLPCCAATSVPVWQQLGCAFCSQAHALFTAELVCEGGDALPAAVLLDDLALHRAVLAPLLRICMTATPAVVFAGTDCTLSVTLTNTSQFALEQVVLTQALDPTLLFMRGSIFAKVDGNPFPLPCGADPSVGIALGCIAPGSTLVVQFHLLCAAGSEALELASSASYCFAPIGSAPLWSTAHSAPLLLRRLPYDFSAALAFLAESVASEQAALAHILNAEGEKIETALALPNSTPQQLLCINHSVAEMLDAVSALEGVLLRKLQIVTTQLADYQPL